MPTLSNKGAQMPASPIRKLVPYATAAKAAGKKVLHLNIGQPDIETPQVALDAVKGMDRTVIEYSNSEGFDSYRNGLAKYYSSVGIGVSSDDVMVTTG
ncbi:MAG: aspartate aminotransferase, partial [Flavobacteriales bacterium]